MRSSRSDTAGESAPRPAAQRQTASSYPSGRDRMANSPRLSNRKERRCLMLIMRRVFGLLAVLGLAFLLGCLDSRVQSVENSVDYAKRMLDKTKTDPISRVAFASAIGQGGDVTAYLAANMADAKGYASYVWKGPPAPYSVVIRRGSSPGEYVIEGYAADADKPSTTVTVTGVGEAP
jgi:hypothetical protein